MKTRPPSLALPALFYLLLQTLRKGYLGCSSLEASGWKGGRYTQPTQFVFFPPHVHVSRNHRYKRHFFYPLVKVECVHAVSEGWSNDQSQHERHLVYQCYLQKHRSTLRDGSLGGRPLPKMMLLAMLPCQVLQQSGSADTAGAYCCLLISGCMQ